MKLHRRSNSSGKLYRPVSVDSLPKLHRAGTLEIELDYLRRKLQYWAKTTGRDIVESSIHLLKLLAKGLLFLPMLPTIGFSILADKIVEYLRCNCTDDSCCPPPGYHKNSVLQFVEDLRGSELLAWPGRAFRYDEPTW